MDIGTKIAKLNHKYIIYIYKNGPKSTEVGNNKTAILW